MTDQSVDSVVIGGGLIGLAVARALALDGHEVLLLESNPAIGQEISSRNSEVIHAGIYYPPGSLKARACVRGRRMLYEYCASRHVPFRRPGKLIVAARPDQVGHLAELRDNAERCGVDDLEWLDSGRIQALEPEVDAAAALLSPSTGIVDSHVLMQALQSDIEAAGGIIATNARVTGGYREPDGFRLQVISGGDTWLTANCVVNAAGLLSSHVARSFPDVEDRHIPVTHLVKGHYFSYEGRSPFSRLVYPLPGEHGLGIHATLDQAGRLRFGPDADYCETIDYQFGHGLRDRFAESIRAWFPALDERRLQPGYTGIRPRLSGPGGPFSDFVISGPRAHGVEGLVSLFGIESPGLTACLALADEVAGIIAASA